MFDSIRKLISLTDPRNRLRGVGVMVSILVAMVLETFSIAMVFPFIKGVIEPASVASLPVIGNLLQINGGADRETVLIGMTAALIFVFVLKNALLAAIHYIQVRYAAVNILAISKTLYTAYLNGPYALYLGRNSVDFQQNIYSACRTAFSGGLISFITLSSEILISIGIISVLMLISWEITLGAAAILGVSAGVFFWVFKKRQVVWGEQELNASKGTIKALEQGLHSIKESRILGREQHFVGALDTQLGRLLDFMVIRQMMAQVPRLWIESIVIICGLSSVLYVVIVIGSAESLLSYMSLFGVAALRMIPSINRMVGAVNVIANSTHAIDTIYNELKMLEAHEAEAPSPDAAPVTFEKSIRIEQLSFSYAESAGPVLKDIDIEIAKGHSIGIVGPSGSGKTTLIDIILGLLQPTSGRVLVDGRNISASIRNWQTQLGYVPQSIYLTDDTLRRNIALGLEDSDIDESRLSKAVSLAHLDALTEQLPNGLDTNVGERGTRLSAGQRQRVGIARALYRDPDVLVFDEATATLDNETEHEINLAIESLRGLKTVIIIAHRLSTVRRCDNLVLLQGGIIAGEGTFDTLKADNETFAKLVELAAL